MVNSGRTRNIKVRPMERKDIFPVLAISKKMPDLAVALTHRDLVDWGLEQQRDVSFVAEVDEKVIGFVLARILFLGIPVTEVCTIQVMGIDPDYHRQHIGSKLIDTIVGCCYAEGVSTVRILLHEKNWQLGTFLENIDFKSSRVIEYTKTIGI